MSNHVHLLLELPPMPDGGINDEELLKRLGAIHTEAFVATVAKELIEARKTENRLHRSELPSLRSRHAVCHFLLRKWASWEGSLALTPRSVRAGMVSDPADYRWSSYGEAGGGGKKGTGKKAHEGLVRAFLGHQGAGFEANRWPEASLVYRRIMGLALGKRSGSAEVKSRGLVTKNTAEMLESDDNETVLPDMKLAGMLMCRASYFTDGAVIGSKAFVNQAFTHARERFGARRQDGARRLRGSGRPASWLLWSPRDLRLRV